MSRHNKKIYDLIFYNKSYTNKILLNIEKFKNSEIVAIYNPETIGIMNSTKDLFECTIEMNELFNKKQIEKIAEKIVSCNIKQVIFSSITFGWKDLIEKIREKSDKIQIKCFWHGSFSMLVQENELYFLNNIINLLEVNIINSIAFAKESMYEFYIKKGYNCFFLPNKIPIIRKEIHNEKDLYIKDKINIGLYSAGERWEKNTFNQLSAISMLKNTVVDILPSTELSLGFCDLMNINVKDNKLKYLKREELLERMGKNELNVYVTFTECSPVVPLESLELGVPCITGNNHHYFKDTELVNYLVVNAEDDIDEIYSKIKLCLANKEKILRLYDEWKPKYNAFVDICLKKFINN